MKTPKDKKGKANKIVIVLLCVLLLVLVIFLNRAMRSRHEASIQMANTSVKVLIEETIEGLEEGDIIGARSKIRQASFQRHRYADDNILAQAKALEDLIETATNPERIYGILMELPEDTFQKLRDENQIPGQLVSGYRILDQKTKEITSTQLDNVIKARERMKIVKELYDTGQRYFQAKQYDQAITLFGRLLEMEPKHNEAGEYLKRAIEIKAEQERLEKQKAAAEAERRRIERENTGMWRVRYYVDAFGEATDTAYITNGLKLKGTFSNSATRNSPLNVDIMVNDSDNIRIQLYEYGRNNPVTRSNTTYTVLMQDKDGNRLTMSAFHVNDRIAFYNDSHSRMIHNVLMKGGTIIFVIQNNRRSENSYNFTIEDADWYENAYRKLQEAHL